MKFKSLCALSLLCGFAYAQTVTIPMYMTTPTPGSNKAFVGYVGTVVATDTQYGLMLTPHLSGLVPYLEPGPHGFHVHVNPSCANGGMAAGGHFDPNNTGHHYGPYGTGHLGDLPVISINTKGQATVPVVAPRLTVADILNHSLMIHQGGDTYSDQPELGGGGMRMICGVIPTKPDTTPASNS
jgi:Cu-Zn family superoxide dismutase